MAYKALRGPYYYCSPEECVEAEFSEVRAQHHA
jgi:hypothetical protein